MSEKRAYTRLKKLHPKAHFTRIESWTGVGIFDVNAACNGVECWIECKETERPKRKTTPIKAAIRQGQIPWEYMHRAAGGKTFIALMVDEELYLLPGQYIKDLVKGIDQTLLDEIRIPALNLFN